MSLPAPLRRGLPRNRWFLGKGAGAGPSSASGYPRESRRRRGDTGDTHSIGTAASHGPTGAAGSCRLGGATYSGGTESAGSTAGDGGGSREWAGTDRAERSRSTRASTQSCARRYSRAGSRSRRSGSGWVQSWSRSKRSGSGWVRSRRRPRSKRSGSRPRLWTRRRSKRSRPRPRPRPRLSDPAQVQTVPVSLRVPVPTVQVPVSLRGPNPNGPALGQNGPGPGPGATEPSGPGPSGVAPMAPQPMMGPPPAFAPPMPPAGQGPFAGPVGQPPMQGPGGPMPSFPQHGAGDGATDRPPSRLASPGGNGPSSADTTPDSAHTTAQDLAAPQMAPPPGSIGPPPAMSAGNTEATPGPGTPQTIVATAPDAPPGVGVPQGPNPVYPVYPTQSPQNMPPAWGQGQGAPLVPPRPMAAPFAATPKRRAKNSRFKDVVLGVSIAAIVVIVVALGQRFWSDDESSPAVSVKLGTLAVVVDGVEMAKVSVNGEFVGSIDPATPMNLKREPGEFLVVVTPGSGQPCEQVVELNADTIQTVRCEFPQGVGDQTAVVLEGLKDGHMVFVDDVEVSREAARSALPLTPGQPHVVVVRAGDEEIARFELTLAAGEVVRRRVTAADAADGDGAVPEGGRSATGCDAGSDPGAGAGVGVGARKNKQTPEPIPELVFPEIKLPEPTPGTGTGTGGRTERRSHGPAGCRGWSGWGAGSGSRSEGHGG